MPEYTDAFFPSWHQIKNSVGRNPALAFATFTNGHLQFFITVQSATCQVLLERPKQMEVRQGKVRTVGL
jgi:hypothetical protein